MEHIADEGEHSESHEYPIEFVQAKENSMLSLRPTKQPLHFVAFCTTPGQIPMDPDGFSTAVLPSPIPRASAC